MLKLLIVFAFLFTLSCSTTVSNNYKMTNLPHSPNSWQVKESDSGPNELRVSSAIMTFYRNWKQTFGDPKGRVRASLDNLMIQWSSKEKVYENSLTNVKGRIVTRGIIKGMTLSPSYVWVKTNMYNRIFATSLVHELVHVSLWAKGCTNGDPDHEGNQVQCWTREHTKLIERVNRSLARADI